MADYFQRSRHDIKITDPSTSNTVGFVIKRENGVPAYQELDGKALADFYKSDNPTQVSTDPEENLVIGQCDFSAGFGKEYYDSDDPKRYFKSIGLDMRFGTLSFGATAEGPPSIRVKQPTSSERSSTVKVLSAAACISASRRF